MSVIEVSMGATTSTIGSSAAQAVRSQLAAKAWAHVKFDWASSTPNFGRAEREQVLCFLRLVAEPFRVFACDPDPWHPIPVDLSRPPNRSRGIGMLPLHVDFVNTERPPELTVLFCARPDPLGGGATILSRIEGVERELDETFVRELNKQQFRDGIVRDLLDVGSDINPFRVFNFGEAFVYRYTGHLLALELPPTAKKALQALHEILLRRAFSVRLGANEAVIIDQRRMVHGRTPLGVGQPALAEDERRLMYLLCMRD